MNRQDVAMLTPCIRPSLSHIRCCDEASTLVIGDCLLHLPPQQYHVLLPLLQQAGEMVPFEELLARLGATQHMNPQRMYRLKRRLYKLISGLQERLGPHGIAIANWFKRGYLLYLCQKP